MVRMSYAWKSHIVEISMHLQWQRLRVWNTYFREAGSTNMMLMHGQS